MTSTTSSTTNRPGRIIKAVCLVFVAALAATACSAVQHEDSSTRSVPQPTATVTTEPVVEVSPSVVEEPAVAAASIRAISTVETLQVLTEPDSAAEIVALLNDQTTFGSARVLLVDEVDGEWIRVQVPVRPNGTTGWVRSSDVTLEEIDARVEVDLAARTITTWIDGEVLIQTSVAVGSAENPTPTGLFFVTDKVDTIDDGGAYGPFALGLSAHSDTLTEFAGGDGQIGIHGTNAPESLGEAVSHGCVRLPNDLIELLATELPLGTPVIIK